MHVFNRIKIQFKFKFPLIRLVSGVFRCTAVITVVINKARPVSLYIQLVKGVVTQTESDRDKSLN